LATAAWKVTSTHTSPIKFVYDAELGEFYGVLRETPLVDMLQFEVVRFRVITVLHYHEGWLTPIPLGSIPHVL